MVAEYDNPAPVSTDKTSYLTSDTLGTPRVITDAAGQVGSRRDYLPFGEEIGAATGGRSSAQNDVESADDIKQKFTGKERGVEMGLDYSINRYYANPQGRFTSPDPTLLSVNGFNPQSWNRYVYVLNNPLLYVDPSGLWELTASVQYKTTKDKDGNDMLVYDSKGNMVIDKAVVRAVKTQANDDGASLAKQLGLKGKEAAQFAAKINGEDDGWRLSARGGTTGRVFNAVETGLTRQYE